MTPAEISRDIALEEDERELFAAYQKARYAGNRADGEISGEAVGRMRALNERVRSRRIPKSAGHPIAYTPQEWPPSAIFTQSGIILFVYPFCAHCHSTLIGHFSTDCQIFQGFFAESAIKMGNPAYNFFNMDV